MNGSVTGGIPVSAKRRGYVLTAGVLLVMMLGGTLPVPLYVLWEKQMGFGPLGVTVVFAAYVVGTLAALLVLGDLSDHVGRRIVLAIAVACAAVSTALFLAATGIGLLIVARVVSGLAAGLATGTATATLAELQPRGDRRAAAVVASGSNMIGLGLGPLTAGLFAEYAPMPTRSVFWAYLGLCALALAALTGIPETVRSPDRAVSLRPRIAVPPGMRTVMLGACLGVFAAFSVLGLFSSVVPTFLHGILRVHNLALVGGASFLIFVIAAISQAVSAGLPSRRSVSAGLPLLLVCLATLESALFAAALWLFLVATAPSAPYPRPSRPARRATAGAARRSRPRRARLAVRRAGNGAITRWLPTLSAPALLRPRQMMLEITAAWHTLPQENDRRNDPRVDGARIPP